MTIYQACVKAGLQIDSHESDLYILATPESRALLREHKISYTWFVSQIDGQTWLEVFGAFDPFWGKRNASVTVVLPKE